MILYADINDLQSQKTCITLSYVVIVSKIKSGLGVEQCSLVEWLCGFFEGRWLGQLFSLKTGCHCVAFLRNFPPKFLSKTKRRLDQN